MKDLKQHAYKNVKDNLIPYDDSLFDPSRPSLSLQADEFFCSKRGPEEHLHFPVANLGQHESFTMESFEMGGDNLLEVPMSHNSNPMQALAPTPPNGFMMDPCSELDNVRNGWAPIAFPGEFGLANHLPVNDISHQSQASSWLPVTTTWGQGNSFLASSNGAEIGISVSVSPGVESPKHAGVRFGQLLSGGYRFGAM